MYLSHLKGVHSLIFLQSSFTPLLLLIIMAVADAGLSKRGLEHYEHGGIRESFKKIYDNVYHPERNPAGYINLGVSENVR